MGRAGEEGDAIGTPTDHSPAFVIPHVLTILYGIQYCASHEGTKLGPLEHIFGISTIPSSNNM
jgi:hypothetical protein